MAPGPPDRSNRFSVLGDFMDQSNNISFPQLPPIKTHVLSDPKYLVISSENNELKKLSPFIIHKGLHAISTLIDSISQLRDGNILLLVRNQVIADKFLKAKTLSNVCNISVKLHETLNLVKGVIYAPCLKDVPDDEIIKELKAQGVVSVYKYSFAKEDGSREFNGYMVLTFNLYNLPKVIDVAWYKVRVKTYFPNPMRCRNCQLLGHTKNRCSNAASCDTCNLPPHDPAVCTRLQCANCSSEHPASDKNCPRYLQQKEIIKIKTLDKCSFGAAKRKYEIITKSNSQQNELQQYSQITKDNQSSKSQPEKQIQKRPAASPNTKKTNKKLHRRESLSCSSSNELDIETPSVSSILKNTKTTKKTEKPEKQSTKQQLNLSTPKTNEKPTTINKKQQHLNKTTTNPTSDILSPLGRLTQELMTRSQYFLTSDMDVISDE